MVSSNLKSSSSLPNLVLTSLSLILLLLSSASLVPILLLRNPPTTFGWALAVVSSLTVLSSSIGFFCRLSHCCSLTHVSLVLTSMVGQALGLFALFLREEQSLGALGSCRGPGETRFLFRAEEGALLGMFLLQSLVLMLSCVVQSNWVREYQGLEVEKEETARKRSRRMARVQEESMVNAAIVAEMKARELDEKMKNKYGQWAEAGAEA